MYEVDFLPVGDGKDSGDAIALRFTHPEDGRWVRVVIDGGFQDDGATVVDHVQTYYDSDEIDLAILTHPDGDHIGGMGEILRGLRVKELWLHDLAAHGGGSLRAATAVRDLIALAGEQGTTVREAWTGASRFGGALRILGPDQPYYDELVQEQLERPAAIGKALVEAARGLWQRAAAGLGIEIPFQEKDVSPRNNSSMITLLEIDDRTLLFTGDAGVPALERAWDAAEANGLAQKPQFVQVPHHGSRRNASSAWLDRLVGSPGQADCRTAFVSVVRDSEKHPSGRVVNAYKRRGCNVVPTAGQSICQRHGTASRPGWGPATPLPPMIEEPDD